MNNVHPHTHTQQINRGKSTWNNSGVFRFFFYYGRNFSYLWKKEKQNNYIQVVKKNILIK